MKTRQYPASAQAATPESPTFPDADRLATLRGWYAGLSSRAAVDRYLPHGRGTGASARGILGQIRQQLIAFARQRQRVDLADLLRHPANERVERAAAVAHAIEILRLLPAPQPQISDDIDRWLAPRAVRVLRMNGITTLADLTVRVPRRRR